MSVPTTIETLQKRIHRAEVAGVPESEINELRECLDELQSPCFKSVAKKHESIKMIKQDGHKIIQFSTSSLISDEDFEGLDIKPV